MPKVTLDFYRTKSNISAWICPTQITNKTKNIFISLYDFLLSINDKKIYFRVPVKIVLMKFHMYFQCQWLPLSLIVVISYCTAFHCLFLFEFSNFSQWLFWFGFTSFGIFFSSHVIPINILFAFSNTLKNFWSL